MALATTIRMKFEPVCRGNFRQEEFLAHENFGTGTFWHMDILAQQFRSQNVCAVTSILLCKVPKCPWCRKFFSPKCPCAEKSLCRNVHGDKMSMCWYVRREETCTCLNVLGMKCPSQNVSCRNVRCPNKPMPIWHEWHEYALCNFVYHSVEPSQFLLCIIVLNIFDFPTLRTETNKLQTSTQ